MIELRDTKAEVHHGHFLLCQQQCNGDSMYSRSVITCGVYALSNPDCVEES